MDIKPSLFLIGVMLFGCAVHKHGLGKRLALLILSIPWIGSSIYRMLFLFFVSVALLSSVVANTPVIAINIPIGMALAEYVSSAWEKREQKKATNLKAFTAIGVLYASQAGGIITPAGAPHNILVISILEKTTAISINFVQWFSVAFFMGFFSLLIYFFLLKFFFKLEFTAIEGAEKYFAQEKARLGILSRGEKNTLFVLVLMLALWIIPEFWHLPFLNMWIVPVIGVLLLFILPEKDNKGTLDAKDLHQGVSWNILIFILSGLAMATLSVEIGVIEYFEFMIAEHLANVPLLYFSGYITAVLSNFISGLATATLLSNILFPVVAETSYHPASCALIISHVSVAIIMPWGGMGAATAFTTGHIKFLDMVKCGIVATVLQVFVIVIIASYLVPLLQST